MKLTQRIILTPLLAGLFSLPVFADTIHLTNGQKLEGKVLEEGADFYQLEVQVTKSIKDLRRVAKSEVSRIEKVKDDVKEFQTIAALIPTPDLLDRDAYAQRMTKVDEFIRKYPKSPHITKAKKVLDELRKEEQIIATGGVKLGNLLFSAEDREDNALDVDARIAYSKMQTAVQNGRLLDAMRSYEKLATDYVGTSSAKEGTKLAKTILPHLKSEVSALLASLPKKQADRESGLTAMSPDERARTKQLLSEQEAAFKKRFEEERKTRSQWPSISEYHKDSLDVVSRSVEITLQKIDKAESDTMQDTGLIYRNATAAIKKGDEKEIMAAIQAATSAKMSRTYITRLQELAKKRKESPAPETPEKTPAPDASSEGATPAPKTQEADKAATTPATAPATNVK